MTPTGMAGSMHLRMAGPASWPIWSASADAAVAALGGEGPVAPFGPERLEPDVGAEELEDAGPAAHGRQERHARPADTAASADVGSRTFGSDSQFLAFL